MRMWQNSDPYLPMIWPTSAIFPCCAPLRVHSSASLAFVMIIWLPVIWLRLFEILLVQKKWPSLLRKQWLNVRNVFLSAFTILQHPGVDGVNWSPQIFLPLSLLLKKPPKNNNNNSRPDKLHGWRMCEGYANIQEHTGSGRNQNGKKKEKSIMPYFASHCCLPCVAIPKTDWDEAWKWYLWSPRSSADVTSVVQEFLIELKEKCLNELGQQR